MKHEDIRSMKIGEIVAQDFRTAAVFKNAGIDFCCGGDQRLDQACNEKKIEIAAVESSLRNLENSEADHAHNFKEWNLDFLCDYIVNTHHRTVLKLIPELTFYTKKIADVHGAHHPELLEIAELFSKLSAEVSQHLIKEEEVLFPAIKAALKSNSAETKETIISEITRMKGEHEFAGGAMDKINMISKYYRVPDDGCNTYQVAFRLLEQFEDDLHIHVHLENNILYPKALNI